MTYRCLRFGGLLVGAFVISACASNPGGVSPLQMAVQADPTGLVAGAGALAGVTGSGEQAPERIDLALIGLPLTAVAEGRLERPRLDVAGQVKREVAVRQATSLAGQVVVGALSGGASLVGSLPGLAQDAGAAGTALGAAHTAQARIDQAQATADQVRQVLAVVPDADRPAEARALLGIAEQGAGGETQWSNPDTGASGRIAIVAEQRLSDDIPCRRIRREYRRAEIERSGEGLLCRQGGIWYDVS
ncbi:MAG TPA: hypothetical protein VNN09_14625 [Candidatus Competibacteraceae bacterium]|nr:hypothetical protein [Candidatus Competibacteraceae bacterium]